MHFVNTPFTLKFRVGFTFKTVLIKFILFKTF